MVMSVLLFFLLYLFVLDCFSWTLTITKANTKTPEVKMEIRVDCKWSSVFVNKFMEESERGKTVRSCFGNIVEYFSCI